jgi:hypothetical protein
MYRRVYCLLLVIRQFNPLNAELNPICHLLALLGAHPILHISRIRVNVHGSVHRESVSIIVQHDASMYSLLYFCKLLYMFRVITPPIIRSTITVITAFGTGQTSENAVCEVS